MKIELDWEERQFLRDLLYQEEDRIKSGNMFYPDNVEVLELIADIKAKMEDED